MTNNNNDNDKDDEIRNNQLSSSIIRTDGRTGGHSFLKNDESINLKLANPLLTLKFAFFPGCGGQ